MKTTTFYNGNNTVELENSKLRKVRQMADIGIPKKEIRCGNRIYCAKSTLEKIKELAEK